jgi:hypothetical protein
MWFTEEPIPAAIVGALDMYKSSRLYQDLLSICGVGSYLEGNPGRVGVEKLGYIRNSCR